MVRLPGPAARSLTVNAIAEELHEALAGASVLNECQEASLL